MPLTVKWVLFDLGSTLIDETAADTRRMAKLIKTVETFELSSKEDAEKMVSDFRKASFPKLVASTIAEKDGVYILEVVKEFGVDVNAIKFECSILFRSLHDDTMNPGGTCLGSLWVVSLFMSLTKPIAWIRNSLKCGSPLAFLRERFS